MAERVLFVSPEAPYPLAGGGAMRTASLLEFFSGRFEVDLVLFYVEGDQPPGERLPAKLVHNVLQVPMPMHSKHAVPRIARNASRLLTGVPPLLDRFSGFEDVLGTWLSSRQYELGVVEHFWCAPYVRQLRRHCRRVCLDLHNIESEWHARSSSAEGWPLSMGHRMFARYYERLERELLPQFDVLLTPSAREANRLQSLCRTIEYPNAIPWVPAPAGRRGFSIVFSGNHEYLPNRHAILFFHREVWPLLKERHPGLKWRILGKNPQAIPADVRLDPSVEITGSIPDAIQELSQSVIAVVPVLTGSGTRVKIVEAWAANIPVVSTALGAEGLNAVPGVHLLLADRPADFAASITGLLETPERRAQLASAGRALYEERYTWNAAWKKLTIEKLSGGRTSI